VVDLALHFRGQGSESRHLPALPRPGDYLDHDGRLFFVSAVAFDQTVNVYLVQVGDTLASELREQWARWGESLAKPEPNDSQQGLF
jgi:hypothetical protein